MNPSTREPAHEAALEDEHVLVALNFARGLAFPMLLKSVLELNVIEIIAAAKGDDDNDDAWISPTQIASQLPTKNPESAAAILDRMLGFLACYSVVKCKLQEARKGGEEADAHHERRLYQLTPIGKLLVTKDEGHGSVGSHAMLMLHTSKIESWCHLTEAVLEGDGTPFIRAHGLPTYKYQQLKENQKLNELFNQAMFNQTTLVMRKIVDTYKGFEKVGVLVDVGGGTGAALGMITSRYPNIKGINFDLLQAVKNAPCYPGVEHIGGDMFEEVPYGDAIFLKSILHNWSDEHCVKLLKNCHRVLPDNGFLIVVEAILPSVPNNELPSIFAYHQDVGMLAHLGGTERTRQQYDALAKTSGFQSSQVICRAHGFWVIEFHKDDKNIN